MDTTFRPQACGSKGFSLVEIMVGMVIGMLGVIVIMQVFSVFEDQKRTSTGGSDAQSTGAIALYGLQRDLRQSGYGISTLSLLGCNLQLPSGATTPLAPVTIYPGGTATALFPATDANTDRILIIYGNTNGASQGDGITQAGNTCTVTTPGPPGSAKVLAYAIMGGNLMACDYVAQNCANTAGWVPIASNIVNMRIQYGKDTTVLAATPVVVNGATVGYTTMDGIVDQYDQTAPTTACGRARISAVRIVLVARNSQYNKSEVTPTAPPWMGSTATPIDLSNDGEWKRYRYKVFQTVVPIKNVIWMGAQTGC